MLLFLFFVLFECVYVCVYLLLLRLSFLTWFQNISELKRAYGTMHIFTGWIFILNSCICFFLVSFLYIPHLPHCIIEHLQFFCRWRQFIIMHLFCIYKITVYRIVELVTFWMYYIFFKVRVYWQLIWSSLPTTCFVHYLKFYHPCHICAWLIWQSLLLQRPKYWNI